jgi:hypothetical protein
MKLARIARHGLDGISARLVVVQPETGRVIDLATAERLRLEKQGKTNVLQGQLHNAHWA